VGAFLLVISTLGPFTFVEAAIVLVGASVLLLLRRRAQGREFHVPFGDGAVIAAAGTWAGFLIVVRMFDRPLGQGLLALVCAAILMIAGLSERAKRPADDLPQRRRREVVEGEDVEWTEPVPDRSAHRDATLPLREVDHLRPAKVLPPPPGEEDLEEPPRWEDPSEPRQKEP
jgi:hypothetical protein